MLDSPDSGRHIAQYDAADRLTQVQDANGNITRLRYHTNGHVSERTTSGRDSGGRPDDETIRYHYTGATLTAIRQRHQSTQFRHDANGRVVEKIDTLQFPPGGAAQSESALRFTTRFVYDAHGRLHIRTLPGGEQVRIIYGKGSRPSRIDLVSQDGKTSRPLATDIDLHPYTGLNAFTHGNGLRTIYRRDRRSGRLTGLTVAPTSDGKTNTIRSAFVPIATAYADDVPTSALPLYDQRIDYDHADRITKIRHSGSSQRQAREEHYGYDWLDRLSRADTPTEKTSWRYDAVGNRLQAMQALPQTRQQRMTYKSESNQLEAIEDEATTEYVYDAAGNPIRIGARDYVYGVTGRLMQVRESGRHLASYAYNAGGERIAKTAAGKTTYFLYHENRIDAEVDEQGTVRVQYVYLDQVPIAKIEYPSLSKPQDKGERWVARVKVWLGLGTAKAASSIYAIHANHLGAPQLATDNSRHVAWSAQYSAFGKAAIVSTTVTLNLRFPGQYFDQETGFHYNYYRDYDPATGRYIQSDSIGLAAGPNTYAYVLGSPLIWIDPLGLANGPAIKPNLHKRSNPRPCNCPVPPKAPPGADVNKNMCEAKNHWNPKWYYDQVRNKGPWDYKQQGPEYQDFGNFNYGATGAAFGWSGQVLMRMAGWAQERAGTSKPEWGDPLGSAPYGDDPDDQEQIQRGIEYARCGCGQ